MSALDAALLPGFSVDWERGQLRTAAGEPVELRPQAFEVLRCLAEHANRLVRKEELQAKVWHGLVVTDDSLVQCIGDIRRALGDHDQRLVRTVPRRGYLLALPAGDAAASAAAHEGAATAATSKRPSRSWQWPALAGLAALALSALLIFGLGFGPERSAKSAPQAPGTSSAAAVAGNPRPRMPDREGVVVLPFTPMAPGEDAQRMAEGMAYELATELGRNVDLRVVSPLASAGLAKAGLGPTEIAAGSRVRYLLGATVGRSDDRLQWNVQLVDALDGSIVWADRLEPRVDELPAERARLVQRVAGTALTHISETSRAASLQRAPASLDVYGLVVAGIAHKHQFTAEGFRKGREKLTRAIELDPQYAPAWAYLGYINLVDAMTGGAGGFTRERMPQAVAQINRAIALDPGLPQAYQALALVSPPEAALLNARRAVALGPGDGDNLMALASALTLNGDAPEALVQIDRALALNPYRPAYFLQRRAIALWMLGRHEEALADATECVERAPLLATCPLILVAALETLGRHAQATERMAAYLARPAWKGVSWDDFLAARSAALGTTFMAPSSAASQRLFSAVVAARPVADPASAPALAVRR